MTSQSSTSSKTTLHSSDRYHIIFRVKYCCHEKMYSLFHLCRRVSSQRVSTTAAAKTCSEKTLIASSTNCWCFCPTQVSSRSYFWLMAIVKLWRSREEERKIRIRRMHGKLLPSQTLLMIWTARCVPRADKYWPPKTFTPTNLCTRLKLRTSLPFSQLVASSASPRTLSPED